MLGALGLSPRVEQVYRALIRGDATDPEALAKLLGAGEDEIAAALADVVERGLAARADGGYVAAPPPIALGALLRQRRDELRQAEEALATLAEEHRSATSGRAVGDLIEVVTGRDAVAHRVAQVQRAARHGVRAFVQPNPMVVTREENVDEERAVVRGVRYRVVLSLPVLDAPGMVAQVAETLDAGEEIRVVSSLPLRMIIADDQLAIVPLVEAGSQPGAVLVHRSGLLEALIALFEAVWATAYPLRSLPDARVEQLPSVPALEPIDVQVMALMLTGLTDHSIAVQLGLSLRTVQRRIQHLMRLAGVTTRVQLGWHAARNGWA
ncbi:MAG TPA: LuxR C-terminal-related transcriptional regulator [Micromonosporaceae bacterium]|nr:LuxR C-terminal-related transcriptional regulator [Micromonosporaceae bacterium]